MNKLAKALQAAAGNAGNPNAWDISKAFWDAGSYAWNTTISDTTAQPIVTDGTSTSSEDTQPQGLFFKPDGTKLFVIGSSGDYVYEYALSSPWLPYTASYIQRFSVSLQDGTPQGLFFKPDGTKMYVLGSSNDKVYEYDLSTAWDILTSSYLQDFSVLAQDTLPTDLYFAPDGTKLFVIGEASDNVNRYDLSTAWDISTAFFVQSFSVVTQEGSARSLTFKPDGTKMYVSGNISRKLWNYTLSTPWDLSTAVADTSGGVTLQEWYGLFFHPSGSVIYCIGAVTGQIFPYALGQFSVSLQETSPVGLSFKSDGTKMYVSGTVGDDINEYNLATPWDPTTATFAQLKSVAAQDANPYDIYFKPDGTALYMVGASGQAINQYSLSVAWDISTLTYVRAFSVSAQETGIRAVSFKPDGTKMYVCGTTGDDVNEYNLSTAWDISTASYVQNFSVLTNSANPQAISFKPDGLVMYIYSLNKLSEYYLSTAWDISTASFNFSFPANPANSGLYFKEDGQSFFLVSDTYNRIIKFTISPT